MANELWKSVLVSSKDQVEGSPAALDHVIVTYPSEVGFVGVLMVRAEARETTKARALSLANIFVVIELINKGYCRSRRR